MDPVTLGIGAVGLGLSLFGQHKAAETQGQISQYSAQNAQLQGQVEVQKQTAMELSNRRQQLESYRNTQQARAKGIAAGVSQGAQFGSGVAGGQASTMDQGMFNLAGMQQNLQIGQNIFGLDQKQSSNNASIASLGGQLATDQGMASLGGQMVASAGTIGNLSKSLTNGNGINIPGFNPIAGATGQA